jgi:hypothetical protein
MLRKQQDSADARQALETWLSQKPDASILVAAIDQQADGGLDIAMFLGGLTGYQIIGLMETLADQAIATADAVPAVKDSPLYDRLLRIKEMIAGGEEP